MRKQITILCCILLAACAEPADVPSIKAVPVSSAVTETAAPRVRLNYSTVKKTADNVAAAITENKWEELSSLFALDQQKEYTASALQEQFAQAEGTCSLREVDPLLREDVSGAVLLFDCPAGILETAFTVNEDLELEVLQSALQNEITDSAEEGEDWREMVITVGNAPQLTGVLTLPKDSDSAPVAILMPEELNDLRDSSGSNETFRKELAHGLAENGVASVRFDMRSACDPLLTSVFGWSFARTVSEDFAAIVHSLELYPVNASRIVYIGHGAAGALGYGLVQQHFELTGGLVLINAPYEEDGVHLFARAAWLDEDLADRAAEAISAQASASDLIGDYPLSWWKEWQAMGALKHTRHVAIPILILQAEDDQIVSLKEDYEDWKSQKGSNVTMKSYEEIGHDLRDEDGVFDERIAEDIGDWLKGVDINKKKDADDEKTAANTTVRRT